MDAYDLDPRWEWLELQTFDNAEPKYVRGHCLHLDAVPVESVTGELVAHLCVTCDTQLPAEWVRPTVREMLGSAFDVHPLTSAQAGSDLIL